MKIPELLQHALTQAGVAACTSIVEHPQCDVREALFRLLDRGLDRLVLPLALRGLPQIVSWVVDRILLKYEPFVRFVNAIERLFRRQPKARASQSLSEQFRDDVRNELEVEEVEVLKAGSPLDYPTAVGVFAFRYPYQVLLKRLRQSRPEGEVAFECSLAGPLLQLQRMGGCWYAMSQDDTSFAARASRVRSFAVSASCIYTIDQQLSVHRTELQRVDWILVREAGHCAMIEIRGSRVAFLGMGGFIVYEGDARKVGSNFVDVALGVTRDWALDETGRLWAIDGGILSEHPLAHVGVAIACGGDACVALGLDGSLEVVAATGTRILKPGFDIEWVGRLGSVAVAAGAGRALFVGATVTERAYPDRVGWIRDVALDDNGDLVICGAEAEPMRVLADPRPASVDLDFDEIRVLLDNFPDDFLLALFDNPLLRTVMLAMLGKLSLLAEQENLRDIVPLLSRFEAKTAAQIVHLLIARGAVPAELLGTDIARAAVLAHPGDLDGLAEWQLRLLLPRQTGVERPEFGFRWARKPGNGVIIPSLRFRDGKLFVFGCGHVLNNDELQRGLQQIQSVCATGDISVLGRRISEAYARPGTIPLPCPNCLWPRIAEKLRTLT